MKKILYILIAFSLILSGCGGKAKEAIQEFAYEELAEALAKGAISSYHEVSVNVTLNGQEVSLSCSRGGSLSCSDENCAAENISGICFNTTLEGCQIVGENTNFILEGHSSLCGNFPPPEESDGVEKLNGTTLTLDGSVTADGENFDPKTCNYSLTLSNITVNSEEGSLTVSLKISGKVCGSERVSVEISFKVEGTVETTQES